MERLLLVTFGRLVSVSARFWQNDAPLVDVDTAAHNIAISSRPRRPFLEASRRETASDHADTCKVGLDTASDTVRAAWTASVARMAKAVGEVGV